MASGMIRKSAIYLVGNTATKLLAVVLIPIYAFFVSASDLGLFDFVQTIAGLASIVFFGAAWEAIIRFTMAKDAKIPPAETIRATVVIGLFGCLGLVVSALVTALVVGASAKLVFAAAGIAALTGLLNVWQYAARAMAQTKLFIVSGLTNAAVNFLAVVIFVCVLGWGVDGLILSFVAGLLLGLMILEFKLRLLRISGWSWPPKSTVSAVLRFTAPLMLNLLTTFLLAGFGRLLITTVLGVEANGQFAFAMKVAVIVTALGQVISMASIEETVLRIGSPSLNSFYSTLISATWTLMLTGGALTVFGGWVLFLFLDNTEYGGTFILIPVLVLWGALAVLSTNYGNVFHAANKTGVIAWTSLAGLIVVMVGATATVSAGGTLAVALWMVAGMFLTVVVRRWLALRFVPFSERKSVFIAAIIYVLVSASCLAGLPLPVVFVLGSLCSVAAVIFFLRAVGKLRRVPDA